MVEYKVGDPLLVRWLDAHNSDHGWQQIKDIEFTKAEVQTLGHFIATAEDQLWLAGDVGVNDDMVNTVVAIPLGWITEIRMIENG
jgi:hypothetical protein